MIELLAESLRRTGRARIRVTGASMLPAIRPGDILEVRARRACEMGPRCVVLFQRGGRLFAHRVVRRQGGALVTRGDTLPAADGVLAEADLLGEVTAVERGRCRVAPRDTPLTRAAAALFRHSSWAGRIFTRLWPT